MSSPTVRTRNTSGAIQTVFRYRWEGDGYASDREIGSWPSLRELSTISDVVGTPKTQRVKPVSHSSFAYTGLPYQPFQADYGLWVRPIAGYDLPQIRVSDFGDDEFLLPSTQIVQANAEAFTFFSERFPTKISGAEFVQGIFELAALLPKLERSVTKTISGGYLTKKFGWDNLISDLNSFTTLCSSIRERMEFLKRTYGRPTKLHFRKPDLQEIEGSFSALYNETRGFGTRLTLTRYQCDYSATATLLQYLGHIDDFIGWLRAIVISLGLNNPLMSIWKTTRLSFVIDWFFNVSGHLARLAAIQPAETWDVSDVSHSTKLLAEFNVFQVNDDLREQPDNLVYLGTFAIKRYQRDVGLPLDLNVFTPSSCTPDQLVLLLAMMGAK